MVFRRGGRKALYFKGKLQNGTVMLAAGTRDRAQAKKVEAVWHAVAEKHAWDILERVTPAKLANLWMECDRDLDAMRQRLDDVNLVPLVAKFLSSRTSTHADDSIGHLRAHLKPLIETGTLLVSDATPALMTRLLSEYRARPAGKAEGKNLPRTVKRSTLTKVHSSWTQFFAFCVDVEQVMKVNPMAKVPRPKQGKTPPSFYERDEVERIIGWFHDPAERAFMALAYGSGIEPSVALTRWRTDINPATRKVRAAGTKAHTRDRMVRVAGWAWKTFWAYAKDLHPASKLFPEAWTRYVVHDMHERAVKGLGLSKSLPLYKARHHYAATHLRAGVPIPVIQRRLGHATPMHTVNTYGAFVPSGADEDAADQMLEAHELERRGAVSGAHIHNEPEAQKANSNQHK